jgi:putative CocE/NonD family hydrolase
MATTDSMVTESEQFEVSCERGVRQRLADGTVLVSDIYRPNSESASFPALLMRQPYGREIASTVVYAQPEYFARAGFLVVIQDVRGRGDSEGDFYAFRNEGSDGIEAINWVAALTGCDGRVCMYGFSYQAYTQLAVLENKPKALVAVAPHMSAADLYSGWFYKNGILRQATTLSWGNQMLREDYWRKGDRSRAEALENSWQAPAGLTRALPIRDAWPVCSRESPANYADDWLAHDTYDDYWQPLDTTEHLSQAELPVFHLAGFYDFYLDGSIQAYACRERKDQDFFILGPWKHIPWERWMCGLDLGPEVRLDTDALLVDWLKMHLGLSPIDPQVQGVRYFTLGLNKWTSTTEWPPRPDYWQECFLANSGQANSLFGSGQLRSSATDSPPSTYVCDPEVPVFSPGGPSPVWGPVDLRSQQQGNNILVFDAGPVTATTKVTGHPVLSIAVSSDVPQTDIVARLSWVRTDGSALFLSLAAQTATFQPDCPTRLELEFDACSFSLEPGECLRLDISGHAYPLLARNSNTGKSALSVADPTEFQRARVTIHQSASEASVLRLPIVPAA